MVAPLTVAQRRFIGIETGINMVLGSVLPAIAMYVTFDSFPLPFWGADGLASFLFKNAFGMGAVMTLLMTLAVRARVAKGRAPKLDWTRAEQPLLRLIPRSILLRAPLFGVAAMAVPGVLAFLIALASGVPAIEHAPFALAMGGASLLVALSLTPFILIGAMTDSAPHPKLEPQI